MNQKQKDTIREELNIEIDTICEYPALTQEEIDKITDFMLKKLDQAYQQGAKDKVEEVTTYILKNEHWDYDAIYPVEVVETKPLHKLLKDNT